MRGAIIAAAVWTFSAAAFGATPLPSQPAGVPWPTEAWTLGEPPVGTDEATLSAALDEAFRATSPHLGETRAVVIVQGGRLVLERYGPDFTPQTRHVSWSVAKSITQALVGAAVMQGKVDVDKPMGSPHWKPDDKRAQIPWRTWLQMTDGQRYVEIGAKSVIENDAAKKLFGPGRLDVAKWCSGLPLIHEPGTHWNYNSCGIVLTADALTRAVVPAPKNAEDRRLKMSAWMQGSLFAPLGMKSATPEFDKQGTYYGSAMIYATARDFARFGLLYLRGGVWDGQRIVPEGWVDFARTHGPGQNTDTYGAGWWLTPPTGSGKPQRALLADGPRDAFSAQGHEGQLILVVPSKDLVIVRLGLFGAGQHDWNALGDWMGKVTKAFPDVPPSAPVEQPAKLP